MIATAIVLIEATDPKVYYYFCIYDVCVHCLMSNFVSVLYIWGQIKFLLLLKTQVVDLETTAKTRLVAIAVATRNMTTNYHCTVEYRVIQ